MSERPRPPPVPASQGGCGREARAAHGWRQEDPVGSPPWPRQSMPNEAVSPWCTKTDEEPGGLGHVCSLGLPARLHLQSSGAVPMVPDPSEQPGDGQEQAEERHRHLGGRVVVMVGQDEADGCHPHGHDGRHNEHRPYRSTGVLRDQGWEHQASEYFFASASPTSAVPNRWRKLA
jgi:hypothetical protein